MDYKDFCSVPFTKEKVIRGINQMPGDKAPGTDSFTGTFFKKCWAIIKGDLMASINSFCNIRSLNLWLMNTANVALVP